MKRSIVVARLAFCAALAGVVAPAAAQVITIKCWKEGCITDVKTGQTSCIREEIPCPNAN
jgi:uncharacterized membrane protein